MDLGLHGRVAVVIGGSSGIGLATAKRLLEEDSRVAICGRDVTRLNDAVSRLKSFGFDDQVFASSCDAGNEDQVKSSIQAIAQHFGQIDILINCAGGSLMKGFFELTDEDWQQQISLKYFAVIYAIRAAIPYLKESTAARIININSTLAREASPKLVSTAATRAGLLNLTKSLSVELAPFGILVNSVSMGIIKSGQWERRRLASGADADTWYQNLAMSRNVPLQRVGEPEEPADVITFLASSRSSYVTGTCIEVDGGMSRIV